MTNVTIQTASKAATWKPPPLSVCPWCSVTHFPTTLHTFCSHALHFHKSSPHFIPRWLSRHPLQLCYDPVLGWVSCQHDCTLWRWTVLLYECLSIMHSGSVTLATAFVCFFLLLSCASRLFNLLTKVFHFFHKRTLFL